MTEPIYDPVHSGGVGLGSGSGAGLGLILGAGGGGEAGEGGEDRPPTTAGGEYNPRPPRLDNLEENDEVSKESLEAPGRKSSEGRKVRLGS